jgi:hypothetical protein
METEGTASTNPAADPGVRSGDDYDGPLLFISDLVGELREHSGRVSGAADLETAIQMTIEEIELDIPFELRVRHGAGGLLDLRGGPPTQRVETTVFPVLHRLRLKMTRASADRNSEPANG